MEKDLVALLAGRRGHFRMESGFHSELWFDLDRLFTARERLAPFVDELADRLERHGCDLICGPMTGGAELARMIGLRLQRPSFFTERIVPVDATGMFPVSYRLPESMRAQVAGRTVAIVDDAISAGSALRGTFADLVACGATPRAAGALFVFGDAAARFATEHQLALESIATLAFGMWAPETCPLCAAGTPVETVSDAP